MTTRPLLPVAFAVIATTLLAWLSITSIGPAWVKTLAIVGVAVVGAFAQSFVDWVRERAKAQRKASTLQEPPPPSSRAGLLRADQHVVPFIGRDEYTALRKWCCNDRNVPVGLLVGGGGVGKTRMALQLGEDLKAHDWSVRVVGADREADALPTMRAVSPPKRPIFLVVDYAETRTGLVELLREVARDPARVRLLLVARSVGDWWVQLGSDVAAVRQLVQAAPRWELSPRVDPSRSSAELVRSAVPHFAAALNVAPPAAVEVSVPDDAPLLVVHAAALVAVLRSQDRGTPAGQRTNDIGAVLDELLGHEMHYWERSAARAGLGGLSPVVLQRAVAVACLFSAVDESDAAALLRRVPDVHDDEPLRRRLARWLRQLYPPDTGYWGYLQPELVAEAHAIRQLVDCPELLTTDLGRLREEQVLQVVRTLSLGATHHPAGGRLLEQLLRAELDHFVFAALEVAKTSGGAVGPVLARLLADEELVPLSLIIKIEPVIPHPTTALAGVAVVVARRLLAALPPSAEVAELARYQERLGAVLAQDGQPAEALPHLHQAVALYQHLLPGDQQRYLPALARVLHRLGIRYAELGNLEEAVTYAEKAAAYYRDGAADPHRQHSADLAACLHNMGIWLTELGRPEQARPHLQEALTYFQALVEVDPGRYLHLRDQAQDLLSHGVTTNQLEELVQRSRRRAGTDRDRFLPELTRDLHALGNRLAGQGEHARAQPHLREALAGYRELARTARGYRSELAACLHDLGVTLASLGRWDEALTCTQEAVKLRRELCETTPQRHRPELAASLDHLVVVYYRMGRYLDALAPAVKAVEQYRLLIDTAPQRFRPDLARALVNLSVNLSELGRHAEALPAAQEAVASYRDLATTDPQRYRSRLVHALDNLAVDLSALWRHDEADRTRHEAQRLRNAHD
jgi:tetratricopeptide (TPR) repeat protein